MPHMMDDFPLLLSTLYDQAVRLHPEREIVSVESDLSIRRQTYSETDQRIRLLAKALDDVLSIKPGQAVGTFAWNNVRHHEIYWATANTGVICHTLNIRLHADLPGACRLDLGRHALVAGRRLQALELGRHVVRNPPR